MLILDARRKTERVIVMSTDAKGTSSMNRNCIENAL